MSEQSGHEALGVSRQADPDVMALLKKIQQQLSFLEKKIDALIGSSQERPFRERHFSKPYRSFGDSQHHGKRERSHGPGERNFGPGHPFEKRHDEEAGGFNRKKRPFFHRRKERG